MHPVVLTALLKRRSNFQEKQHPRGPDGRFIKIGMKVRYKGVDTTVTELLSPTEVRLKGVLGKVKVKDLEQLDAKKPDEKLAPTLATDSTKLDNMFSNVASQLNERQIAAQASLGEYYDVLNGALRTGDTSSYMYEEARKTMAPLNNSLEVGGRYLSSDVTVYRSVPKEVAAGMSEGQPYTDAGYMSTTTDKAFAESLGGTVVTLSIPRGTPAMWRPALAEAVGNNIDPGEQELLVGKNVPVTVVSAGGTPTHAEVPAEGDGKWKVGDRVATTVMNGDGVIVAHKDTDVYGDPTDQYKIKWDGKPDAMWVGVESVKPEGYRKEPLVGHRPPPTAEDKARASKHEQDLAAQAEATGVTTNEHGTFAAVMHGRGIDAEIMDVQVITNQYGKKGYHYSSPANRDAILSGGLKPANQETLGRGVYIWPESSGDPKGLIEAERRDGGDEGARALEAMDMWEIDIQDVALAENDSEGEIGATTVYSPKPVEAGRLKLVHEGTATNASGLTNYDPALDDPAPDLNSGDKGAAELYPNSPSLAGMRAATPEERKRLRIPPAWQDVVINDNPDEAVDVGADVNRAADLLAAGQKVQLDQPRTASTLLKELARRVQEAKANGADAPNFDLCRVSVPKTNLFCAESKGIPRVKMPQLSGVPTPGSKADGLEKDDRGGVNLGDLFRQHLTEQGVAIEDTTEKAAFLRASQIELNGGKVAGMTSALDAGKVLGGSPSLFVSQDNYIVDGHHRWAAHVGHDVSDNTLGDVDMDVARVDMSIIELLDASNAFATEWGIPQASVSDGKNAAIPVKAPKILAVGRDAKGREQRVYSAEHAEAASLAKFTRVRGLNEKLPVIDQALARDAPTNDTAAATLLIRRMGLRPGSTTDTGAKVQAYGATTLLSEHVVEQDGGLRLQFTGKKGVHIDLPVKDPTVAAMLRDYKSRNPTGPLFPTASDSGVRDYLKTIAPGFKAKDFRTHTGTGIALTWLDEYIPPPPADAVQLERLRRLVAKHVAEALGNTPIVALQSYIDPTVFQRYQHMTLAKSATSYDRRVREHYEVSHYSPEPVGLLPDDEDPDD